MEKPSGQQRSSKHAKPKAKNPLKVVYISNPMKVKASGAAEFRSLVQELTGRHSDIDDLSNFSGAGHFTARGRAAPELSSRASAAPVGNGVWIGSGVGRTAKPYGGGDACQSVANPFAMSGEEFASHALEEDFPVFAPPSLY